MDWRRFNIALIQDFLQWERDFAKSVRPDLPCTTNISGPLDNWFAVRLGDPYAFSKPFDFAGIDIYPAQWSSRWFPGFAMDMTLGAAQGRPAQVIECDVYSGEKWGQISPDARAALLESTVWSYAGHGAKGILLWTLSGQQGFGLTRGEYNPSVRSVREIAHTAKMLRLGAFHKPARQVALCVDQDAYIYYGGIRPKLEGGGAVSQTVDGLYGALASAHLECDVICADQIRRGIGSRYRAIVLATPVMMDARLADALASFVKNGGTLIAESPFAELDRWGRKLMVAPGFGLQKVFGLDAHHAIGTETAHRFGMGIAVLIKGGTPDLAASAAQKNARLDPIATVNARGAYLDCPVLDDARGNRLVIVANPPDHAHPLTTVTGAVLSVQSAAPGTVEPFAFPPTRQEGGKVTAGPERLSMKRAGTRVVLALPPVASAMPILLARDAAPVLAISAPASVSPGAVVDVHVTCFNPSPREVRGTLSLMLPAGWDAASTPVDLPARADRMIVLHARAGAQSGRCVVKARLASAAGPLDSVPVDITVSGPPR